MNKDKVKGWKYKVFAGIALFVFGCQALVITACIISLWLLFFFSLPFMWLMSLITKSRLSLHLIEENKKENEHLMSITSGKKEWI